MRDYSRRTALALALGFGAACSGAKTDRPVVTNAEGESTTSASGEDAAHRGHSLVRVVNAMPATTSIDISSDDRTVFRSVDYKEVTPYVEVDDNLITFRLRPAGGDSALANNHETLADGHRYTIVALPDENGEANLRILRDEVVPDSGMARLRVINASPQLGEVDVAVAGEKTPIFNDVNYGVEAGYKDIIPMTGTLDIRIDARPSRPIQIKQLQLAPGKAYTIVLTGMSTDKVEAITFDDSLTDPARGLSLVRLSHARVLAF